MRDRSLDLEAARAANRLLLADVEAALRSRAKWRQAARALEADEETARASLRRVTEEFKAARARDLAALEAERVRSLKAAEEVERRAEDERVLSGALQAVRAELGRLLDTKDRPPSWVLGEVRRIRDLTGVDGDGPDGGTEPGVGGSVQSVSMPT